MFFKFIWNGKPDKIKRETLTRKYLDGGLNMLNLHNFVPALKITWLRRFYHNPHTPWAKLARTWIGPYDKVILLGSNYSKTIARKMDNKFWKEILDSWSTLIEGLSNHRKDLSLPIWYNTELSNHFLYCPKWYNAGIISIADLLTSNGDILTETDLNTIYNVKTNFLEYHRVIKYIKAFCNKVNDRSHMKPIYHSQTQILLRSQKGSKDFYNRLNNINVKKTTSYYSHWEQALKTKITEKDWKSIYQNCFKTVEDNDLVWFQYRLLNRILGTNEYLVKIKQKVNANCSFCKKETENITHLFIECNFVKKFWTDLKRNLHFSLGVDLNINPSDIIFGILDSNNKQAISDRMNRSHI